ncbi:MAG: LPS assembly lipoprotein LptE [Gammaproteobacteria bacterium]|nr:LPS assembly lipoprotein LptE [Gammaproteobacteria bacterium]
MSRLLASVLLALLVVQHYGCGFHLRTWELGASVSSFYVDAPGSNLLAAPLRRALRQAGVEEARSPASAQVVVGLLSAQRERRSVSFTKQARAAEYEMNLGVQYRILDGVGNELVAPRWARSVRVFRVDRGNIVGNSEEQALLEQEMRNDLIQQIVRTLNAVAGPAVGSNAG